MTLWKEKKSEYKKSRTKTKKNHKKLQVNCKQKVNERVKKEKQNEQV